jgi:hypothetical protein
MSGRGYSRVMTNRIRSLTILATVAACASSSSSSSSSTGMAGAASSSGGMTFAPSLGVNLGEMKESPTGLWVKDIQAGTGAPAISGDFVRLEYRLHLADGTPIDSVVPGQTPFEFRLGQACAREESAGSSCPSGSGTECGLTTTFPGAQPSCSICTSSTSDGNAESSEPGRALRPGHRA